MSYLIDTDWIINFLDGRSAAIALFDLISTDSVQISVITCGEVLEGFHRHGYVNDIRIQQFTAFTAELSVIPVDQHVAGVYARERAQLRSTGMLIPDNDLWIAATTLSHDLTLVTSDQHFNRIVDLQVYDPEQV